MILQAPRWLPCRVRSRWDQGRINRALADLGRTAPRPVLSAGEADAEVHMLLCRRDVKIAVLALKSLLRFETLRLAVTLTDDGSLREADRLWIERHIAGCRWLPRRSHDPRIEAALASRPHLRALYDSGYQLVRKLVHPLILSEAWRAILLDPDTAFFAPPQLLIEWTHSSDGHAYYMHDIKDESRTVPPEAREAFRNIAANAAPGRKWSLDYYFFNSGLLAFRPELCDLDLAESYLRWRSQAPPALLAGRASIWLDEWTREQTAYQVMFGLKEPRPRPVGERYRIGCVPGAVFNHFLREGLVRPETLRLLAKLVTEL